MSVATAAPTQVVWQIDPSHSLVEFSVKHMMFATVKGRFARFTGQIVTGEDPTVGSVEVAIDADSVDTRDEGRDNHLRTNDFFGAGDHPQIVFRSTRVEPTGPETFKVHGELTIRDVTRPVVLDATFNGQGVNPWGATVAGYSATATIDRDDFGVNWNAALETGGVLVGRDVKIHLEVEATRQG